MCVLYLYTSIHSYLRNRIWYCRFPGFSGLPLLCSFSWKHINWRTHGTYPHTATIFDKTKTKLKHTVYTYTRIFHLSSLNRRNDGAGIERLNDKSRWDMHVTGKRKYTNQSNYERWCNERMRKIKFYYFLWELLLTFVDVRLVPEGYEISLLAWWMLCTFKLKKIPCNSMVHFF